jgi:hypothetical protein
MRVRLSTLLVMFVASCSSDGAQTNPLIAGAGAIAGTSAPPAGAAGATAGSTSTGATSGSGAAGAVAGSKAAAGSGGAGAAAGSSAAAGSGGAGNAGTAAAAGTDAAGAGGAPADPGTTGAAGMPAPVGPIDLAMMGPYKVIRDQPVGEGFEYPIASSDTGDGVAGCADFAAGFGGDAMESMDFVKIPPDLKMNMYSLYRPETLEDGKKYPIITWGNGTCALPEGYGTLLKHWASHGFFVVAANSRQVGSNSVMTKALDWAFAANKDSSSPYFGKIDTDRVAAAGHSQGGMATITAARDSRVKTVIIFNGGASATKPYFAISGDRDIPFATISSLKSSLTSATKAAWLWYHMVPERGQYDGHLTLITEPERVVGPSTAFFKSVLQDDADAKTWFEGTSCKLCGMTTMFEFGQKGI